MKKIVIAMLLILPLIIVASVMVATNIIINEAYIAVESVVLNVEKNKTLEVGLSKGLFQFQATVYPTGAKNKGVVWSLENIEYFGDETKGNVQIDQNGLVKFFTYGTFDVVATTLEGQKTARCNVYVKCDTLDGVSIDVNKTVSLKTGEKLEAKAVLSPLDAEVEGLDWSSSDPSVLSVDGNGILTARAEGTAVIQVKVREFISEVTMAVVKGVTVFGTEFSVSGNLNVSDLQPSGQVSVVSGAILTGDTLEFVSDTAILNVGNERVTITVCDRDEIVFEHAERLKNKIIYIGKPPIVLRTIYRDAMRWQEQTNAIIVSVDTNKAEIKDGKIFAKARGTSTFTATNGASSCEVLFEIVRPVDYVRLTTVNNDDIRGIAGETVYGTQAYYNGELSEFRIPLVIQYPENADWSDFDLEIDNEDLAYIDGQTVVVYGQAAEKQTLTITLTAHHSSFVSMAARTVRRFLLLDGVNCKSYDEVLTTAKAGKNIMLQADASWEKNDATIELQADFYGNGYLFDGSKSTKSKHTVAMMRISKSDVRVSNAILRFDDIAKINQPNGMSGVCVSAGDPNEGERLTGLVIEYSVMENCYYAVDTYLTEIKIDGCIMRNTSNFGIYIPNQKNNKQELVYSDVVVNNSVMSNIVATAVGISTNAKNADKSPLKTQSTFKQTGFLDIYNWQDITSMRMLDRELIPGNPAADSFIRKTANALIAAEIKKDIYAPLRFVINDVVFVNLGIVTAGATNPCTTVPEFEDDRFITFPISILDGLGLDPCVLYLYNNTANITPDMAFTESAELYQRLRGN